ncbi:MAG: hypothetical protein ACE5IR_27650, partial [bacterium]
DTLEREVPDREERAGKDVAKVLLVKLYVVVTNRLRIGWQARDRQHHEIAPQPVFSSVDDKIETVEIIDGITKAISGDEAAAADIHGLASAEA